ncbi:unnamed protein product [Paramecium sonneborni]|uniref:Transmembrane protein n=1 Tax=Paramecium sonneborni TaxID=65129 RepID=A0A8S1M2H3_9CILI|nr:unnamed protein product [Paramecium sonneborni]
MKEKFMIRIPQQLLVNVLVKIHVKHGTAHTIKISQDFFKKNVQMFQCKPGYHDFLNFCQDCPTAVDISFIQCYKYCNNNQIQHNIAWDIYDFGFQLIAGVCQPICGDLEKKGHDNSTNLDDLCYNCQFQGPFIVQIVIKQLLYLVHIFVQIDQLEELKNVRMETLFNIIDALIVNFNVNFNAQNVLKQAYEAYQFELDSKLHYRSLYVCTLFMIPISLFFLFSTQLMSLINTYDSIQQQLVLYQESLINIWLQRYIQMLFFTKALISACVLWRIQHHLFINFRYGISIVSTSFVGYDMGRKIQQWPKNTPKQLFDCYDILSNYSLFLEILIEKVSHEEIVLNEIENLLYILVFFILIDGLQAFISGLVRAVG